jgi:hypothetical protein
VNSSILTCGAPRLMEEGTSVPRVTRLGDMAAELEADAVWARECYEKGIPRGPVTGLPKLDQALGGFLQPGLHPLHGNTGSGKTALALQIAASCGCPALFVSCEMSLLELTRRVVARTTSTYLGRLKSGELMPEEVTTRFRLACAAVPLLTLVDATMTYPNSEWLLSLAEAVRGESRDVLLVLDSLHAWVDASPEGTMEYEALNVAVERLRSLGARLSAPVLMLAERNRASMNSGGLNAGAGSRKIEYRGESTWDLDRNMEKGEDASGEVPVTVKLAKNRHGVQGIGVKLSFNGALQRFRAV